MSNADTGRRALHRMLEMIGDGDATDHDIARVLVDAELDIRVLLDALSPADAAMRKALEPLLEQADEEEQRVWARRYDEPQGGETAFIKLTWAQINAIRRAAEAYAAPQTPAVSAEEE